MKSIYIFFIYIKSILVTDYQLLEQRQRKKEDTAFKFLNCKIFLSLQLRSYI